MTHPLDSYIAEELAVYQQLNMSLESPLFDNEAVEAVAKRYEKALEDCLFFKVKNLEDLGQKLDFLLTLIERSYEDIDLTRKAKQAIHKDIKSLAGKV